MDFDDIKCCANNCESTANGEISFFRFPPDRERCDYWLTVIGREDLKETSTEILSSNYFVCSLHFDESYLKEVDGALIEEPQEIQVEGEDSKDFLGVQAEDMGRLMFDEAGNLVYLQGTNIINVKSEDIQYEIQQEQGDIITMAISDDRTGNIVVKNGDEILSVLGGSMMERKLYNEDSQVKVEKMDHLSEEEMMHNQVYGDEEEEEEEDDDEEEDEDDEEGGGRCLCDSCGQPFSGLVSLRQHFDRGCPGQKMEEGGINTFKCARCEMEFTMFDQMKAHIRKVHTQSKSYPCDVCGTSFGHRSNLSRHKLQHCSAKKFQCDQCGRGFSQRSNLISHQTSVHAMEHKQVVAEVITRPGAERIHRKPKKHKCKECGKLFVSLTGLKNHDAIHRGHRPFICAICQKSFTLMSCLKTHMNTIHSDKKHYCELCGKSYQSEHYLKTHLRIHSGAKDHICEHCLKGFIDQPSLKLHMRTHTGEKPFTCKICSRSFTQQSHLKTHTRIHTGEKPFRCDVCGKAFRQLSNVLEHNRTHKK